MSEDEWNAIPEVGDARNKKQRNAHIRPDRYTPVPDSVLHRAITQGGSYTSLDSRQQVSLWDSVHCVCMATTNVWITLARTPIHVHSCTHFQIQAIDQFYMYM